MKSENDKFIIEVQYDEESKKEDLIKITPKTLDPLVFNAEELLDIIANYTKKKDLALSLTNAEVEQIVMCEVERTFIFTAGKAYKKGETASFNVKQQLPVVLALLEEEYKRAKITSEWVAIDKGTIEKQIKELSINNTEYFKKVNQIKDMEKKVIANIEETKS